MGKHAQTPSSVSKKRGGEEEERKISLDFLNPPPTRTMGVRRNQQPLFPRGSTPNLFSSSSVDDGGDGDASRCNVVVLGEHRVGKTSLVTRAVHDKFTEVREKNY